MTVTININRHAVYRDADAAKICGLPVATLKQAARNGDLPTTRRGTKMFVEGEVLWRWLTGRPQADLVESSSKGSKRHG